MSIYTGRKTDYISFPLGGIGTGSIGLGGNGRLLDCEINGRPDKGSLNGRTHIAVKAETEDDKLIDARILNGDCNTAYSGQYGLNYGHGLPGGTMAGFPHFRYCSFDGRFPIAVLSFQEDNFPGKPELTAYSPFIPLNDRDSSIPCAVFEIDIKNTSSMTIYYTSVFALCNSNKECVNKYFEFDEMRGIYLDCVTDKDTERFNMAVATDDLEGSYQEYWYRGGWSDAVETYWRNLTEMSEFHNRNYNSPGKEDHCTLVSKKRCAPGETVSFRFILTWSKPYTYNYWHPYKTEDVNSVSADAFWKNYYATLFADSRDSAKYCLENIFRLRRDTFRFRDELFSSTLPEEVIDAASANLSVLRTATCMRLENSEFYGWEGLNQTTGSCEGTCTHVWNYAYAMCFLFPALERSIRETDYKYNIDSDGWMRFRTALPLGRPKSSFRACVDGQMGGVIKTYRDFLICGDIDWLRSIWPEVKLSLEYAWSDANFDGWDADFDGVLEGRQHHTLDMELFGPSSWLEGMYLCALRCGELMADILDETESAEKYHELFEKGKRYCDRKLFNGKWYIQNVDLSDKSILEEYTKYGNAVDTYWNEEAEEIKYQIGEGCAIDQLLGQWHANIIGLGDIFDKEQRKTALRSLYENNFKSDMRNFYNPFRIYCVNSESGTVICDYPEGVKKPTIPIPYTQETMHGFEYALAG
ncbi:MAG: hypothetical protein GX633_02025, partial [Clostridiales bacterium]|nr:hypothetical protein [Clostridiales bacterium]